MIPPLAAGDTNSRDTTTNNATIGDTSNQGTTSQSTTSRDTTANNATIGDTTSRDTTANNVTTGDVRDTPINTTAGDIVNVCGLSTNVAVAASG